MLKGCPLVSIFLYFPEAITLEFLLPFVWCTLQLAVSYGLLWPWCSFLKVTSHCLLRGLLGSPMWLSTALLFFTRLFMDYSKTYSISYLKKLICQAYSKEVTPRFFYLTKIAAESHTLQISWATGIHSIPVVTRKQFSALSVVPLLLLL